jgi:PEP-CTERM motif
MVFGLHDRQIMIRIILSGVALLLLFTSPARASTINLLLTVDMYEPTVIGPRDLDFSFSFFQSASNGWPDSTLQPRTFLVRGGARLLPGVAQYNVSLDAGSLDDLYFTGFGSYQTLGTGFLSIYVAEPPDGAVPDRLANQFGPPWIALSTLGDGFSGEFQYINGFSRGDIGTWSITPAPENPIPAPEPASMLLFGSGLAALAAKKYRQSHTRR